MNCSRSLLPFFMDKDIRNFFGAKPKNGEKNGSNDRKEPKKRPKPVALSSSDSEDEVKREVKQNSSKRPKNKAAAIRPVISSSDSGMNCTHFLFRQYELFPKSIILSFLDNDFVDKPPTKNAKEPKKKENLKPVNPNDFFADAKPRPKQVVAKGKSKNNITVSNNFFSSLYHHKYNVLFFF